MPRLLRGYLRLLAVLTAISCVGQLALPADVGTASAWGGASGWQREIGIWYAALFVIIVRTLRAGEVASARTVAVGLVVLEALVSVNHFATVLAGQAGPLNLTFGSINGVGAVIGVVALWQSRVAGGAVARG